MEYRLQTEYQNIIAVSRYSRWVEEEGRREIWPEPVARYVDNVVVPVLEKAGVDPTEVAGKAFDAIASTNVMPSMRALMTAGPALERDHVAGYNCSFIAVDHPRAFDEILYVLTCGTGVGFSCEEAYTNKLPEVAESFHETDTPVVVSDSRIGWASAFREVLALLWAGKVPKIDASRVRPKGARLMTFGGRASGPEPLVDLFKYCTDKFKKAAGRKLTPLEVHGIVCKIGEVVVVGGVRRSALISLSDLYSHEMRNAKAGDWRETSPEFALANNSAVYTKKPGVSEFLAEWKALYDSKSGERGLYNRQGIRAKIERIGRRDAEQVVGTNPCAEIALRNCGFCNLTEVVVKPDDTLETLKEKVALATILGTIQSTFTDFRYIRKVWKTNAEEERLLGVSLTGIYDNPLTYNPDPAALEELCRVAVQTNKEWAAKLGINPAASITCNKPSGTVSQLVDSASGIHPRHSKYYIRTVRSDNKDPMTLFLKNSGVPWEPCVMKPESTTIFSFPMKAPEQALTRDDVSALDHLELWKIYNDSWAEHQVSITVSLKEDEWLTAGAWVYDNFDSLSGISFLPYSGGAYKQAPYQEITKEQYEALPPTPVIDWTRLKDYEKEDTTTGTRELACVAGLCEI